MTALPDYAADRRLDILILGPMDDDETVAASCLPVQMAVQALLAEPPFQALLEDRHIAPAHRQVHVPERIGGQDIVHGVLSRLDIADLVIFNMTPKGDAAEASPNVMYELALVHALGIPAILVRQDGRGKVPFYAAQMRQQRVARFEPGAIADKLRQPLLDFLDPRTNGGELINSRVTQFYHGLPILDISAATGLATGYYYNFVSRLITEGGFIGLYPDRIRQVVVVRPSSVGSSYPADLQRLHNTLAGAGINLTCERDLQPPPGDSLGPLWFSHVDGIVVDLPRTIYPLKIAPRLLSFKQRHALHQDRSGFQQRLQQFGEQLLDRVQVALTYHMSIDEQRIRPGIVHFTAIDQVADLVNRLRAAG